MELLDPHRGLIDTVVHNDAHQLCQGGRAVSGTAEGGGVRGDQRIEGIAHARPLPVNFQERFDFKQMANA